MFVGVYDIFHFTLSARNQANCKRVRYFFYSIGCVCFFALYISICVCWILFERRRLFAISIIWMFKPYLWAVKVEMVTIWWSLVMKLCFELMSTILMFLQMNFSCQSVRMWKCIENNYDCFHSVLFGRVKHEFNLPEYITFTSMPRCNVKCDWCVHWHNDKNLSTKDEFYLAVSNASSHTQKRHI